MLRGFMDHWVPTRENISSFWKADFNKAAAVIDGLLDEIAINNFTFYTKWYTNGICSRLPFLQNHPDSSNVRTKNEWGRRLIEHLHHRGLTAGAMLQLYTYEKSCWEKEMVLHEWDVTSVALTDGPDIIADFTRPQYRKRLEMIIEEHLRVFPELDYLFLEFEGVGPEAAKEAYRRWNCSKGQKRTVETADFSGDDLDYCSSLGIEPDFCWSIQAKGMIARFMSENLAVIQDVLTRLHWKGIPGLVYHIYGYESRFFPGLIPDKGWWLLPWHYWGGEKDLCLKEKRWKASIDHLRQMKAGSMSVCCIGDATITPWNMEAIRSLWKFSMQEELKGYLGMGNPSAEMPFCWPGVTPEHVTAVRKLFAREIWKRG